MTKTKIGLLVITSFVLGSFIGYWTYSNTKARYDTITTACVIVNEGIKQHIFTSEQAHTLGHVTGVELHRSYNSVANKFNLSQKQIEAASPDSTCSQFIVEINKSKSS